MLMLLQSSSYVKILYIITNVSANFKVYYNLTCDCLTSDYTITEFNLLSQLMDTFINCISIPSASTVKH